MRINNIFNKSVFKKQKIFSIFILFEALFIFCLFLALFGKDQSITIYSDKTDSKILWNEKEYDEKCSINISNIELNSGSYDIQVYFDVSRIEEEREKYKSLESVVYIYADDYPLGVKADNKIFAYGDTEYNTRVNIDSWCSVEQLKIQLDIPKNYSINKIVISEFVAYRVIRLIVSIVLIALIDILISGWIKIYHSGNNKKSLFYLGMGLTLLLSLLPALKFNSPTGDDYIFHLSRIFELSQEILEGRIPVRIYQGANNGYSYASPLFYCDTFLYIPALLYLIRIPLRICYNIYVILTGLLTLLTSSILFKKIFGNDQYGYRWVGSTIYLLSYYRIVNVYSRCAVGEYTAMAFLPLVLIGIYGFCNFARISKREIMYIIVGISGIIQCHLISAEIVGIVAGVYSLFYIKKWFNKNNVFRLIVIAIILVGLNIWFIYPMLDSWSMNLAVFVRDESAIQKYGLYLNNLFSLFNKADGSAHGIGGGLLIGIGFGVFVLLYIKESLNKEEIHILRDALIITFICLVLTLAYFPWDTIADFGGVFKNLTMIQFPWRYLSIASLTGTIVTALAIKGIVEYSRQLKREYLAGLLILCVIIMNMLGLAWYYNDIPNYTKLAPQRYVYSLDHGIRVEEYILLPDAPDVPYDTLIDIVGTDMNDYSLKYEDGITAKIIDHKKHLYSVKNYGEESKLIVIPIMAYDNYHVTDIDTEDEFPILNEEINNQYIVTLIPGKYEGKIKVVYKEPAEWRIAEIISLISLILCILFVLNERRKSSGIKA